MNNIYYKVVTSSRGFLSELYNTITENSSTISFIFDDIKIYEKPSVLHKILSKMIRLRIWDYLGVFQVLKVSKGNNNISGYFSYNRFLKSDLPYIIYLENPYALVNYSVDRMNHFISKKRLCHYFNDGKLKAIVCLSKVCKETLEKIYDMPISTKVYQVYPMINDGILNKTYKEKIYCLFIASEFSVKGGLEILEAFERLNKLIGDSIVLTIITPLDALEQLIIKRIKNISAILKDFNQSKEDMKKEYEKSHIILNPTRMDSFSLVTLESMKYGCVYIGTDVYAIPEMIQENTNGYLISTKLTLWDNHNLMDSYVNSHRKETIYSPHIQNEIVNFIVDKIIYLNSHRGVLEEMSKNAFDRSNNGDFSCKDILKKWENILE